MTATDSFLAHWYFHIPNLVMAALIYTLLGRYVLTLIFASKPNVVILRVFQTLTNPVLKATRLVTPAVVPNGLVMVFAAAWLMALRMFWYLTCVALGMRATVGA